MLALLTQLLSKSLFPINKEYLRKDGVFADQMYYKNKAYAQVMPY